MNHKNCIGVSGIRNIHGDMLPYSVQSTEEQVKEWANEHLAAGWAKHEEIGDKVEHFILLANGTRDEMIAWIDEYLKDENG